MINHNRLYKYLIQSNILCSKRFGFQRGHLTEHAFIQLADQYLGIFVDLKKTFKKVNHSMLMKYLKVFIIKIIYGIKVTSLK